MSYKRNPIPNNVVLNSNILPQMRGKNLSTFNLSESLTTSIKFDKLYPLYWQELNPGDHFEITVKSLGRLAPMITPPMSNIKMKYFAFWVPNRLLWEHWVNFMGERTYQSSLTEYTIPQINMKDKMNSVGQLADYLGVPPTEDRTTFSVSALPFRAYNKIWNEWFRANQLQNEVKEISADSGDVLSDYQLLNIGKPLDYFTSCLSSPQAGDGVTIGLAGNAPVMNKTGLAAVLNASNGEGNIVNGNLQWRESAAEKPLWLNTIGVPQTNTNLYADMSAVTGITINQLRYASALQELLERDARAGELYVDLMKEHFGTNVPDFLVGRSQFLGSTTTYVSTEPIAQTSETATSPQGTLASVGYAVENEKLCEISVVEHGILMIMGCVTGEVTYQQGLDRKFSKLGRYDYMFPEFWNLGEQTVLNKEIYLAPDSVGGNDGIFGYQERYKELRIGISKITGFMRSGVTDSLDIWHLAQKFNNTPVLNSEFIQANTPIGRILAAPSEDHLLLNVYWDIKATRCLPVSANPSFLAGRI
ncbi:major capsid protein [Fusobacterium varium]|uniref:major capsid protein n=1 Tax=Fusobacterium varium TaxID=856 RepID=UPI002FF14AA2